MTIMEKLHARRALDRLAAINVFSLDGRFPPSEAPAFEQPQPGCLPSPGEAGVPNAACGSVPVQGVSTELLAGLAGAPVQERPADNPDDLGIPEFLRRHK